MDYRGFSDILYELGNFILHLTEEQWNFYKSVLFNTYFDI